MRGPYSLTRRQQDALRFIRGFQLAHGFSPSILEIAAGLRLKGKSRVHTILASLEERGHLSRLPRRSRAIDVLSDPAIPCAPDGAPLFSVPGPWEARD